MKRVILMLVAVAVCSMSVSSVAMPSSRNMQSRSSKTVKSLVTPGMASKISYACLNNIGYCLAVFCNANSKYLDNAEFSYDFGTYYLKVNEILYSLDQYPEYAENFIYAVYDVWGDEGLWQLNFTPDEIGISHKIINKFK